MFTFLRGGYKISGRLIGDEIGKEMNLINLNFVKKPQGMQTVLNNKKFLHKFFLLSIHVSLSSIPSFFRKAATICIGRLDESKLAKSKSTTNHSQRKKDNVRNFVVTYKQSSRRFRLFRAHPRSRGCFALTEMTAKHLS